MKILPALFGIICVLFTSAAKAEERPNILFILTDDQAAHTLDAYGDQVCDTPNIDSLAEGGMHLTDAHHMGAWTGAVCTASRTMIMTGRTVWHLPNFDLAKARPLKKLDSPEVAEATQQSMPALFNAAGYDTFRTCKKGNSFNPANQLFQVRRDKTCRGGAQPGSDWHGDQAINYLETRQATNDNDPFLMFLGFSHPHDPRNGPKELVAKYGAVNTKQPPTTVNPKAPKLPINYLPEHPFHHGHPKLRDEVAVQGVLKDRSEATVRNEIGREFACIEAVDIQIGRVLEKLKAMSELKNTYVIFTSDHGMSVGRHGLMGKQNLYEHTWRVPLLVQGPGIKPGSQASGYTYLLDVLPTICDFAGIEVPASVEGKSFRPVLEGKTERVRDILYGTYSGGTKPGIRAVKTDGWKLIKYDVLDGKVCETQLFNLHENPRELLAQHHTHEVVALTGNKPSPQQVDLAEDPAHAEKLQELEALLLAEQKRLDDPYRLWDQE
ncbi:sulfatase-like hydrolase/transferase [Adhaeretor mobilis]|uniref:Arylsulfatase n=1 Tax=Adhaeretor mobilis TaxID=1930276 RepID=A0A517N0E0_9BACT|nr:sulfatase-like hydrolase/transferase [Adhaeretor mobilis]QDT00602.1 Arylsulfatase [Adhaeretor mobilis]